MTIREILPLEHPLLRKQAKKVHRLDRSLAGLVADMFGTMHAADGAASPEITNAEGVTIGAEGCLSLSGFVGEKIPRAATVQIRGKDQHGRAVRLNAEGYFARILQHEIDHLDGVLFTDRLHYPDDLRPLSPEELAAAFDAKGGHQSR